MERHSDQALVAIADGRSQDLCEPCGGIGQIRTELGALALCPICGGEGVIETREACGF